MSKQDDNTNWQAFGLRVIEAARETLESYESRKPRVGWHNAMSLTTARWVLREAEILKLVDRDEDELGKIMGRHR